jgi:hypothetical protein
MGGKKKHEVFESTFVLEFEEGKDRRPTMGFCGGTHLGLVWRMIHEGLNLAGEEEH